ncbi:MAG: hypothetical protein KDD28_34195, partial [Phaeodactylibacter sp.]|nr:hypothetical protein [Phaeodactylibacter sp.]
QFILSSRLIGLTPSGLPIFFENLPVRPAGLCKAFSLLAFLTLINFPPRNFSLPKDFLTLNKMH